jgi:hypothetical protein
MRKKFPVQKATKWYLIYSSNILIKFHSNVIEKTSKPHAADSKSSIFADETPAMIVQLPKRKELGFPPKQRDNSVYQRSPPFCINTEPHSFFRSVNSDVDFDPNCQDDANHQTSDTRTTIFDNIRFRTPTSSLTQSEGTEMTSWDEWDEASDMLSHIDPITACNEGVKIYSSLL